MKKLDRACGPCFANFMKITIPGTVQLSLQLLLLLGEVCLR